MIRLVVGMLVVGVALTVVWGAMLLDDDMGCDAGFSDMK